MSNHEKGVFFGPSPEAFNVGREVFSRLPRIDPSDDEPDYQLGEKGLEELGRQIESGEKPTEHEVFRAEDNRFGLKKDDKPNNPWEPFNMDPHPSQRFINLYQGPYSQQMELHRTNAERLLEVGAIEGIVTLVDIPRDRSASGATITGVNSDGSASSGKFKSAEKEKSVKSAAEGWKIEIPGEDILDELSRQDSKEPIVERFTEEINQSLRSALTEIIIKEKMAVDSIDQVIKYALTAGYPALHSSLTESIPVVIAVTLASYTFLNFGGIYLRSEIFHRSRRQPYEYLMPLLEMDRALRGVLFTNIKGRNLVRLKEDG